MISQRSKNLVNLSLENVKKKRFNIKNDVFADKFFIKTNFKWRNYETSPYFLNEKIDKLTVKRVLETYRVTAISGL